MPAWKPKARVEQSAPVVKARISMGVVLTAAAGAIFSFAGLAAEAPGQPVEYGIRVVATYDHDPQAFTQGLVAHQGVLYEGTGGYGASSIRKVDLETGRIVLQRTLPERYFGEGIAIVGQRLVQLTWRARTGFVYDLESFELLKTFNYPTEGWGLTYDGARLLMSDGSASLYVLDPETFGMIGKVLVRDRGKPLYRLNELEYVAGFVYANVWQTDRIAKIEPKSGRVVAWIDLAGLRPSETAGAGVLNGIAYDATSRRLLVTGKLWPKLFAIDMVEK
jgi:glutamine cyclotransferase